MSVSSVAQNVAPGFEHPTFDAQAVFRTLLESFSFPGRIGEVAVPVDTPGNLDRATTAAALALLDSTTPVWLGPRVRRPEVEGYLRFHCGCPLVDAPELAAFSIVSGGALPRLQRFAQGTDLYPDRSCTVIVQVQGLGGGPIVQARGPGVEGQTQLAISGLPEWFWHSWQTNYASFPLGVDVLFTSGGQLLALPRSITAAPEHQVT